MVFILVRRHNWQRSEMYSCEWIHDRCYGVDWQVYKRPRANMSECWGTDVTIKINRHTITQRHNTTVWVTSWHGYTFCTKPFPKPMLNYCQMNTQKQTSVKFESKYDFFSQMHLQMLPAKLQLFCTGLNVLNMHDIYPYSCAHSAVKLVQGHMKL